MDKNLSIVILAAGKGSRMHSSKAKVLHSISGKAMLYHITKTAKELSDDVSIVVAHQALSVKDEMAKYFSDINFIDQDLQNYPGTGGALKNYTPKYKKVLVLNGDMPLISKDALAGFLDSKSDIAMSVLELNDASGYGRVVIKDGEVLKIVEQKDATKDELDIKTVNGGVYMFSSNVLDSYIPKLTNNNAQGEYYLTDVIELAKKDSLKIEPILVDEHEFKGVNSKLDLAQAEVIMQDKIKVKWMENGVVMQLPSTIYIEDSVVFEGECVVENGVKITGDSKIINSHIKSHSVVEDSLIENSDIGPLAHIRPSCSIKDTHIGNFVEVKKSSLNGVKAGHLSYLGDSTIERGTNIGAGVITCNYDGVKKYQTHIGKDVFVGSDTQLVAPLKIEDNVLIAAGSTITKDIKTGSLAISRTKQSNKDGFFYKFFGKK
ncbi:MAG: bifunctional UDP-N-acetylglucosamine diphosphorylase/glucosamine-1-phosphate N-acetyltransferase GlmU [Sulfurimonadaceae bacterium]|jgi:bifunctional UDP-N-acetylglucosamine pyrophosphorylase/glucosamine-1-phosphate N-acetyltransferase|nr:bifunctional UDP-N-acetylglucosamine diphosphorylase/glucosamine-1-phosphate N-acetyltransferase GlmU [Sulfurimonadaceae bacterium]